MSDVLRKICAEKRDAVAARKAERPHLEDDLARAAAPRGFRDALAAAAGRDGYGLICEIKKASPSRGLIREDFDAGELARAYREGGATCLSILTDAPYFQGSDEDLVAAQGAGLPCLRKDFMLEPYQIYESRALGADCVLLIMAALGDTQAAELSEIAQGLGMDVLVEVHDRTELERGLELETELVGINNRNLKTLEVSLSTTLELAPSVPPDRLLVCESGLSSRDDLLRMREAGARAFLIGESLMRQPDVAAATHALLEAAPAARETG